MTAENLRKYGASPYSVVLVHGGPGAPGEMAPVARELSKKFGILEPLQTRDSIDDQVAELKQQIIKNADTPIILVGWSWGAWLSFILIAENPSLVKKLILVSSGPFEAKYAESIMPIRLSHLGSKERKRVELLMTFFQKGRIKNAELQEFGQLIFRADSYDPIERTEIVPVQADIHTKVWKEAEEMRKKGKLLSYGKSITCPVVVIHGDYDPHPYKGVKTPLSKELKDCKFILLKDCGHHPWLEKGAGDDFYKALGKEL